MSSNATTYVTTDKRNINELSDLFKLSKYHKDTKQFIIDCGFYDNKEERQVFIDILKGVDNNNLRVYHLRQVVNNSEHRVTLEQLSKASGLPIDDSSYELRSIKVARNDIYWCDFGNPLDSVQGGRRPAIVLQNKMGNDNSPTILVAPLSTAIFKRLLPTHIDIGIESGLSTKSTVLLEQITTVSKSQLMFNNQKQYLGTAPEHIMQQIDSAIKKSLGLIPLFFDEQIAKEYLLAIKGIEDARKLRNTSALQMAQVIITNQFAEYCADYSKDHKKILSSYKEHREQRTLQRGMIQNEVTRQFATA